MKRLIEFLLTGCWHNWEIIKEEELIWSNDLGEHGTGSRFTLQCKKCGNLKKFDAR
jgi:hypothetical protein